MQAVRAKTLRQILRVRKVVACLEPGLRHGAGVCDDNVPASLLKEVEDEVDVVRGLNASKVRMARAEQLKLFHKRCAAVVDGGNALLVDTLAHKLAAFKAALDHRHDDIVGVKVHADVVAIWIATLRINNAPSFLREVEGDCLSR